ncbi:MAG: hypothetical protein Satyrvirus3_1, partial [Satyrvirus sp.]
MDSSGNKPVQNKDIIEMLQNIGSDSTRYYTYGEPNLVTNLVTNNGNCGETEMYDKMDENKIICKLINIQFKEFFDNIYIPFKFFKYENWKINKVLYDNEDALFYNPK